MAPLVRRLRESNWAAPYLIATGQHDTLLERALFDFRLEPDCSFVLDRSDTDLVPLLAAVTTKLNTLFQEIRPDCVIAQGDTASVFASALAAFYRQIPFVHVEAGLRTNNLSAPFPEEFHRRAIAVSTFLHCAPTASAAFNLRSENIPEERILISGNTIIDALLQTAAEHPSSPANFPSAPRTLLLTAHRRENFGKPLRDAFRAIRAFLDTCPDTALFFPVHPNPAARWAAYEIFSNHPRITLADPLSYREMVGAMRDAWLIVTDSGGLQEEAPALGKPVLVLREVTERPEAVEAGGVQIVGTKSKHVFDALLHLHRDGALYEQMAQPVFPYGDGHAAKKIVERLRESLRPTFDLLGLALRAAR